ncbi:MAG: hypothetical protein LIR35_06675 [Bacteroidota bacterium]|nr:hypothetical protein [Bacteroidota bacterium]
MSKGLTYFLGIVTGIILTFGFFAVIAYTSKQDEEGDTKTEKQVKLPNGVTMLDTPVPFDEAKNFEIIQVVFDDAALANSGKEMEYTGSIFYTDPVVLILSEQKNTFYDDQIVKCPKDSKVMRVGTYKYQTKMGVWKTVPIIRFVNAQ